MNNTSPVDPSAGGDDGIPFVIAVNLALFPVFIALVLLFEWYRQRGVSLLSEPMLSDDGVAEKPVEHLGGLAPQPGFTGVLNRAWHVLTAPADEVVKRGGFLATLYLELQKCLIIALLFIAVVSNGILLPINMSGGGGQTSLTRTTFQNIEVDPTPSAKFWAHALVSVLFNVIVVAVSAKYLRYVLSFRHKFEHVNPVGLRAVWVKDIPADSLNETAICQHFQQEGIEVARVVLLEKTQVLEKIRAELETARANARRYQELAAKGQDTTVTVRTRSGLRYSAQQVDGVALWTGRVTTLEEQAHSSLLPSARQELGSAIVVFSTVAAVTLVRHHRPVVCQSLSHSLCPGHWTVHAAPDETEVLWGNLHLGPGAIGLRMFVLNLPVLLVFFFFTSPATIVTTLENLSKQDSSFLKALTKWVASMDTASKDLVLSYLPTLLVLLLNSLLLTVLDLTTRYEGHHTLSKVNKWIFRKSYTYLVLNTLVLPGLLLTSLNAGIADFAHSKSTVSFLGNLFLVNSGGFFINYLIQATFMGSGFQLIHLSERLWWCCRKVAALCTKDSTAVTVNLWPFYWGYYYAYILAVFSITLVFSAAVPLISIAGLVYFGIKYLTDKYDIMVLSPPEFDTHGNFSKRVAHYPLFSLIMFDTAMATWFLVRGAQGQGTVLILCLCIVCGITIAAVNGVYPRFVVPVQQGAVEENTIELTALEEAAVKAYTHPLRSEFQGPSE